MAATFEEVIGDPDKIEDTRVMDGYILRQEIFRSVALATKLTITYNNAGAVTNTLCEDI